MRQFVLPVSLPITSTYREFLIFYRENPKVWDLFVSFCNKALDAGRKKAGGRMIMEVIRWEMYLVTTGDDYKINNNHVAHYVRLWLARNPDHPDFFETRERPWIRFPDADVYLEDCRG